MSDAYGWLRLRYPYNHRIAWYLQQNAIAFSFDGEIAMSFGGRSRFLLVRRSPLIKKPGFLIKG